MFVLVCTIYYVIRIQKILFVYFETNKEKSESYRTRVFNGFKLVRFGDQQAYKICTVHNIYSRYLAYNHIYRDIFLVSIFYPIYHKNDLGICKII